jgi:hypothetical protein
VALTAVALFVVPAQAATLTVNTTTDLASDGVCNQAVAAGCTMRDALAVATSADAVTLPAGLYQLNPNLGPLLLVGDKLNGVGARTTIIDGGLQTRVMDTANDTTDPQNPVASQVSGVTIRRGSGVNLVNANDNNGSGGGIYNTGTLGLLNSQIVGNNAIADGGGIGMGSGDNLVMIGSTIAGNTAGRGGGIFSANEALVVQLVNSTVSGNSASSEGGAYYGGGGSTLQLLNATVAGNQAPVAGGIRAGGAVTLANTILAGNSGGACGTTSSRISHNTLVSDNTCALTGAGDIQGVDPGLGALANNGGPTDTRAIGPSSLAINRGVSCQATDQRGVARPQGGACDIGAYEYRAPLLTVIKRVVNNDKGIEAADDFTVHVLAGAADVMGSPAPGSATGRTYTLTPGSYTVGEDASEVYAASFAGDCSATGVVVLAEGQSKTCTITNDDKAPRVRIFNVEPKRGTVRIKLPGKNRHFRRLTEGEQLPAGTTVDTRKGRVTIIAASDKKGGTSRADFYAGIFKLGQTKGKKPITTATLVEKLTGCKASGKQASAAATKKRKRRLWGDGKGRFQTKGKHSAATVVGTKWLVEDRCTSTLTRVARGKVKVRDFEKHKTVFVRKGHRYIARAQ